MTFADNDPAHINIGHNELVALIQEQADLMGITVTLPDSAGLGDTGHVDDHNLIVAALQTIADEATGAATVSGTTGSPATTSITGYTVYEWTANGSFTLAAGFVEYLVQGGGGSNGSGNYGGGGGNTRTGIAYLAAGTYTVTVGAGGATGSNSGGASEIVGVAHCLGGLYGGGTFWGQGARGGAGDLFGAGGGSLGSSSGGTGGAGVTSSITGTSLEYGKGGNYPGPTAGVRGGGAAGSAAGGPGTVIIRVKV